LSADLADSLGDESPFLPSYRKLLLSLKQAIPAAGKSEMCNVERQEWVVPVLALTADRAPELHKTIGRVLSFHIVGSCSYQVASTGSVVLEFADETDPSGSSETVRLPKAVARPSRIEVEILLAVRSDREYH